MSVTLVGVFEEYNQAEAAQRKLEEAGIGRQTMQLTRGQTGADAGADRTDSDEKPGAISRFFSNLFGSGDSHDAAHYSEAVRRGNPVLTVDLADEKRIDEVSRIMEGCGAVDVDERVEQWKSTGYSPGIADSQVAGGSQRMDAVQEDLKVGKRTIQKGGVRVHGRTVDTPVEEQVSLHDERAVIDRKKVDRPASEAETQSAFKDRDLDIHETTEEPVVSKSMRVTEEVNVGSRSSDRTETVRDTLRHTEIDVDKTGNGGQRPRATDGRTGAARRPYSGPERRRTPSGAYAGQERRAM